MSHDLPSDLIPLAVDHKINQNYPKLLNISIINAIHSKIYIPKLTIFRTLKPVEIENAEINETSRTKTEHLSEITMENLEEIHQCSQNNNELPTILPQSSFQPEPSNHNRQYWRMLEFPRKPEINFPYCYKTNLIL